MQSVDLVYIIDDDDIIIYLTNKLLIRETFCNRIKTFTSAEAALVELRKALREKKDIPDIILFDINMPKMNGWMFIDEFEKLESDIPTFVFTSSIDTNDKQRSYQYKEIKGFITKPLTKISIEKIRRVLVS